jgi:hypothetical protein
VKRARGGGGGEAHGDTNVRGRQDLHDRDCVPLATMFPS